jgi:hypothetical protein
MYSYFIADEFVNQVDGTIGLKESVTLNEIEASIRLKDPLQLEIIPQTFEKPPGMFLV